MKKYLLLNAWLPAVILINFKVASTEWFLGVQIQNFENPYDVEIIGGGYCCCDEEPCSQNINELQGNCTHHESCDPYFLVHIRDSSCNGMCSLGKTYQLTNESNSSILDGGVLSIPFKEMELTNNSSLIIEVWDDDDFEGNQDIIDNFTFSLSNPLKKFNSSNSLTVQGHHKVGILTLSYGNLTTDTTPVNSVEYPASSTSTLTHQGSTWTHLFDTSLASQTPTSSTFEREAERDTAYVTSTIIVIVSLVAAILLIITSTALGIIACLKRKSVKALSAPKLTPDNELRITTMKEETADDVTNHAEMDGTLDTAISETQEKFDYLYSTVNKKKEPPKQPDKDITEAQSIETTAAAPDETEHVYRAVNKRRKLPSLENCEHSAASEQVVDVFELASAPKQEDSTLLEETLPSCV